MASRTAVQKGGMLFGLLGPANANGAMARRGRGIATLAIAASSGSATAVPANQRKATLSKIASSNSLLEKSNAKALRQRQPGRRAFSATPLRRAEAQEDEIDPRLTEERYVDEVDVLIVGGGPVRVLSVLLDRSRR